MTALCFTPPRRSRISAQISHWPYHDSGLAQLFNKALGSTGTVLLQDFSAYAPSNGQPAAFIGQSIQFNQQRLVVAARINRPHQPSYADPRRYGDKVVRPI